MSRYEYKYLLPMSRLDRFRDEILPFVTVDPYASGRPNNQYEVRSLYWDTRRFEFYHDKINGYENRKKVRIRAYNNDGSGAPVYLEIKQKIGSAIIKYRAPVGMEHLQPLIMTKDIGTFVISNNGVPNADDNARRFFFEMHHKSLIPCIGIHYDREAYFYRLNPGLRITFDKSIRCTQCTDFSVLKDKECERPVLTRFCILEIKTGIVFPSWLNRILGRFDLRQESLSKYTMCLDHSRKKRFIHHYLAPKRVSHSDKLIAV